MILTRRAALAGGGALLFTPALLRAATRGTRRFRVIRDGSDIGSHVLSVTRKGSDVEVAIDIELKVKLLGITAYRYEMANRELWRDGQLVSMKSKSNDDGDPAFATVTRTGGMLSVEGSVWSGEVAGDSATTTYWATDFLTRPLWISTADGDPLKVTCTKAGTGTIRSPGGALQTDKWRVTGDMDIDLHYVNGEWASVRFDAGGEDALYEPDDVSAPLSTLWNGA